MIGQVAEIGQIKVAGSVKSGQQPTAIASGGGLLVTAGDSGPMTVWKLNVGPRAVSRLPGNESRNPAITLMPSAAFAPGGRTLATVTGTTAVGGATVSWWNLSDPAHPVRLARRALPFGAGQPAGYSPDGRFLDVSSSSTPGAFFGGTPSAPELMSSQQGVTGFGTGGIAFEGNALAVGDTGAVSVWDATSPADPVEIWEFGDTNGKALLSGGVAASPGSGLIAATSYSDFPSDIYSGKNGVQLWNVSPILDLIADPVAAACRIDGGRLTPAEWRLYARNVPRQRICG